jgi:hypothetical protein
MGEDMAWSSAKEAGFALAAWLADDRNLSHVAAALEPAKLAALRAGRLLPGADRAPNKVEAVQQLLRALRPALDERALGLAPRARTLLARLAPTALRKQLLEGSPAGRAHYHADAELLAVLLRAARNAPPRPAP